MTKTEETLPKTISNFEIKQIPMSEWLYLLWTTYGIL